MKTSAVLLLGFISTLLATSYVVPVVAAVACNPSDLSACANAILTSAPPTADCCAKLKQQQSCFCQYMKNPTLKNYINSGNGRKVANTCKVPLPHC